MIQALLVESDDALREALRPRLFPLQDRVTIVRDPAEARVALLGMGGEGLVVARGEADAAGVDSLAAQLPTGPASLAAALVVLEPGPGPVPAGRAAGDYLIEVERVLAALLFPLPGARTPRAEAWRSPDWPLDLYQPLEEVPALRGTRLVLARDRMTGALRVVVEAAAGHEVIPAIYGKLRARPGSWCEPLRHVVRGSKRFVASSYVPREDAKVLAAPLRAPRLAA